jgi:hypothetical protein
VEGAVVRWPRHPQLAGASKSATELNYAANPAAEPDPGFLFSGTQLLHGSFGLGKMRTEGASRGNAPERYGAIRKIHCRTCEPDPVQALVGGELQFPLG